MRPLLPLLSGLQTTENEECSFNNQATLKKSPLTVGYVVFSMGHLFDKLGRLYTVSTCQLILCLISDVDELLFIFFKRVFIDWSILGIEPSNEGIMP